LLAVAVPLLGACYICVFLHRGALATGVGWFGFVFFGLTALKIVVDILRPRPRVIINDEGIEDRRLKIGVVPWKDIAAIELRRMGPAKFFCVEVRDPDHYVSRMPAVVRLGTWANGLLGHPPVTMTFAGLSPPINDVWST
jgi:hypothetical protein